MTVSISGSGQFASAGRRQQEPATKPIIDLLTKAMGLLDEERFAEAGPVLDDALGRAKSEKQWRLYAVALSLKGEAQDARGQNDDALRSFGDALKLFQNEGDRWNSIMTLVSIGMVFRETHRPSQALQRYKEALHLVEPYAWPAERLKEIPLVVAKIHNNIGVAYWDRGEPAVAGKHIKRALAVKDDPLTLAQASINLGNVLADVGDPREALKQYEAADALLQAMPQKRTDFCTVLNNRGVMHYRVGELEIALGLCKESRDRCRNLGNISGEARALSNIGAIELAMGMPDEAFETHSKAHDLAMKVKDYFTVGMTSVEMGRILLHAQHRFADAERKLSHALQVFHKHTEAHYQEAEVLVPLGQVAIERKEYGKAVKVLNEYIRLARQRQDKYGICVGTANLGYAYDRKGEFDEAERCYRSALSLVTTFGDLFLEASLVFNLAILTEAKGRVSRSPEAGYLSQAETLYLKAVDLSERLRSNLNPGETRSLLTDARISFYRGAVRFYHAQSQKTRAYELAQKVKARSLLDILDIGKVGFGAVLTPSESADVDRLQERQKQKTIALRQSERGSESRTHLLKKDLVETDVTLRQTLDHALDRVMNLPVARIIDGRTSTLAAIAQVLTEKEVLLEYTQTTPDEFLLFVGTKNGTSPQLDLFPLKDPILFSNDMSLLRSQCATPGTRDNWRVRAARLARALIPEEVWELLRGKDKLIVCPDGRLWDIPFGVLSDANREPLALSYEVVYAHSGSLFHAARLQAGQRYDQDGTTLFAVSDFGGRREPIQGIAQLKKTLDALFPSTEVFEDGRVTAETVRKFSGQARYLNFLTHGARTVDPWKSYLVLHSAAGEAENRLTARDMIGLDLSRVELAFLGACDMEGGSWKFGEGLLGFVWALLAARCPSAVVAQWPVSAAATLAAMEAFYSTLARQRAEDTASDKKQRKTPVSTVLQETIVHLAKTPGYEHPFFWAPYVLFGH